jgi:hypothetical protein
VADDDSQNQPEIKPKSAEKAPKPPNRIFWAPSCRVVARSNPLGQPAVMAVPMILFSLNHGKALVLIWAIGQSALLSIKKLMRWG